MAKISEINLNVALYKKYKEEAEISEIDKMNHNENMSFAVALNLEDTFRKTGSLNAVKALLMAIRTNQQVLRDKARYYNTSKVEANKKTK
jgi:hypothetical protein